MEMGSGQGLRRLGGLLMGVGFPFGRMKML